MINDELNGTFFAPAGRVSPEELRRQVETTMHHPLTQVVLEAVSGYVLILNEQRQILSANQEVLDSLKYDSPEEFAGLRPGEIFNCAHFKQGPDGCGTAPHCRTCGAVLSILLCQASNTPVEDECRMSIEKNNQYMAADYKVRSTPLKLGDHSLTILVLQDISAYKRREILEKVFIHDFLNMVGGIQGWSEQLGSQNPELAASQILFLSTLLKEEIRFHNLLLQAEKDELVLSVKSTNANELINHLQNIFVSQKISQGKHLHLSITSGNKPFLTDPSLLLRILINMVKNAYEGSEFGETIRINFEWIDQQPTFRVENQGFIPPEFQEHIFERSFSTKGDGRGLGTYSIKLFGEHYLKGKIGFKSSEKEGTSFSITLPFQTDSDNKPHKAVVDINNAQTVLVVEDEDSHALLQKIILEKIGFKVQIVKNGLDALKVYLSQPEKFNFVITDFSMTGMDGLELTRELLKINPALDILLCSGVDDSSFTREAKAAGVKAVSIKPTTKEEMEDFLAGAGLYSFTD